MFKEFSFSYLFAIYLAIILQILDAKNDLASEADVINSLQINKLQLI